MLHKEESLSYCCKDIDELRALLKEKLSAKRYYHSKCVAEESLRLAKLFRGDLKKAYLAGLLHDITKDEPLRCQKARIENGGIVLNTVELQSPQIWHAISGMVFVRDELEVRDMEILNAIRYHTTARAGMSLLEKIVYLADCTSRDRIFDTVEKLRITAYQDIDRAILFQLKSTIAMLAKQKQPLHLDTVYAYNQYCINHTEEI